MLITKLTRLEHAPLALTSNGPVTTIRFAGRPLDPLELAPDQEHFTIGADGSDLVIPRTVSTAVSPIHASLDRAGHALFVADLGSQNGCFPRRTGPHRPSFHLHAGDTFWLADVPLLATSPHLEALRSHLAVHLGLTRDPAVDDALTTIAAGPHLLLLGPPDLGARDLSAVIHATGPNRRNPYLTAAPPPRPLLDHAPGATVFIDLDKTRTLPARTAAALFDPARGLRLIFAAAHERTVHARLDHYRHQLRPLHLTHLSDRPADVPALLYHHWLTALDIHPPLPRLSPAARRALVAYPWPHNLAELHSQSPRILAYLQCRSLRRAAASLDITHQTLSAHLDRLSFPLDPPA